MSLAVFRFFHSASWADFPEWREATEVKLGSQSQLNQLISDVTDACSALYAGEFFQLSSLIYCMPRHV